MFSPRVVTLLLIAAILSLLASLLVKKMVTQSELVQEPPVSVDTGKTGVLVAAADIGYLHVVQEGDVRAHQIASPDLPADASLFFSSPQEIVGKVAMTQLRAGLLLMRADFKDRDKGATLALEVRTQYRAVSIRVDDVRGVSGFLLRGNLVDVLAARDTSGNGAAESRFIAEGVRVLAVDQEVDEKDGKALLAKAITVELLPDQAEELAKAQLMGTVEILLRNPEDVDLPRVAQKKPTSNSEKRIVRLFKGGERGAIQVITCEDQTGCVGPESGRGGQQ